MRELAKTKRKYPPDYRASHAPEVDKVPASRRRCYNFWHYGKYARVWVVFPIWHVAKLYSSVGKSYTLVHIRCTADGLYKMAREAAADRDELLRMTKNAPKARYAPRNLDEIAQDALAVSRHSKIIAIWKAVLKSVKRLTILLYINHIRHGPSPVKQFS